MTSATTIQLYQFPNQSLVPNLSTFCMKVEVWLRLVGLPYEVVPTVAMGKAPYGKLPYIRDGEDIVADSHSIIEHLKRKYAIKIDDGLSAQQKAVGVAFDRLLSDHLYWCAFIYPRWAEGAGWQQIEPQFFGKLPPLIRQLAGRVVRKGTLKSLHGHGMGRMPRAEIYQRAEQDLQALADQLGTQPYFLGREPHSIDAAVYAWLANIKDSGIVTPLKAAVEKHPNLVDYCARMQVRCFPEKK